MFNWISDHRADIAAILILALAASFIWSIIYGYKQSRRLAKEQVFGDPERTLGGWYWAVCGVSALMLVWFYYSWGMARAFFPTAANEVCQIAKIDEALSPVNASLPISSRYFKSTTLVVRNSQQLAQVEGALPQAVFSASERSELLAIIDASRSLISILSNEQYQDKAVVDGLDVIRLRLSDLKTQLDAGYAGLAPTAEALAQPRWGVDDTEIGLLPKTARGMMYDAVSAEAKQISDAFLKLRNLPDDAKQLIDQTKSRIDALKQANKAFTGSEDEVAARNSYVKSVERIFRRLDDGTIFPSTSLTGVNQAVISLYDSIADAKGGLSFVEAIFMPGGTVVKSKTLCVEQGSSRWLPKPTDVVAKFGRLASPDLESGGGFKGTTLLWWKWLEIADLVDFFIPDGLVDMLPGQYGTHNTDGEFDRTVKDRLLAFASGDVYLGAIPMLDGHIWDSMFRVIIAMMFGIVLGVPLGIFMGVSRFFKSFFDPLIELYRPVPPLAWAPLILTIFGIQDDGKIFLLFMVAFAIMVISARTGASGTQLSKIRAAHSLGATQRQIVRYVILPNALPEILTGVRISIGVCWGTLVAAEMLAGTTGIGFIENVARTVSDYELIWVTILIMGLLGLFFDLVVRKAIAILIPWRGKG